MTSLVPYEPSRGAELQLRTVTSLTEWAEAAKAAYQVASSLVQTSFVPEAFRGKAHEATAAILAGDEVGLSPMASLRSFDVIGGTAAPRAMTLRAIIQSRGHEIWVKESTDTRAIVCGRRAGSELVQESVWDIARAKTFGLLTKSQWRNQPKAMLIARATAEVCRLIASDAILGIPYAFEELADGEASDLTPAAEPTRRTARRRAAAPAASPPEEAAALPPGPPLPGEEDSQEDEPAADGMPDPITRAQQNKLHATLGDFGIDDRADKLTTVGLLIQRELASSSDLTKVEASAVIDILDRLSRDDEPAKALDAHLAQLEEAEQDGGQ